MRFKSNEMPRLLQRQRLDIGEKRVALRMCIVYVVRRGAARPASCGLVHRRASNPLQSGNALRRHSGPRACMRFEVERVRPPLDAKKAKALAPVGTKGVFADPVLFAVALSVCGVCGVGRGWGGMMLSESRVEEEPIPFSLPPSPRPPPAPPISTTSTHNPKSRQHASWCCKFDGQQ